MNDLEPGTSLSHLKGIFALFPGPVFLLDHTARIIPVNDAGKAVADRSTDSDGMALVPGLIQLAVTSGSKRRAIARTLSLPDSDNQVEFVVLPQDNGTHLLIGRDTTFDINVRAALAQSRTRFKDLVDVAADFAWETDSDGVFCYISPVGAVGYQPEELLGLAATFWVLSPDTAPNPLPFLSSVTVRNVEIWVRDRNGQPACLLVSSMPITNETTGFAGTRGIAVDVTRERQQQSELARLKLREHLVAYIINALRGEVTPSEMLQAAATALTQAASADSCVVQVHDRQQAPIEIAAYGDGVSSESIEHVTDALSAQDGLCQGTINGQSYLAISTSYQGARNGAIILWRPESAPEWDDDECALLGAVEPQFGIVFRQISDQISLEQLSRTDGLTGLPNRRAFIDDFNREMVRYERYNDGGALLFVDLDNFKEVNDIYGHAKGDEALRAIAEILTKNTRVYDLVCRLGGDEFAIMIEGATREIAQMRAESFLSALQAWNEENLDPEIGFGMSIGVVIFEPGTGETFESLIVSADAAMYEAKKLGKNRIYFAPAPAATDPPDAQMRRTKQSGDTHPPEPKTAEV